MHESAEDSRKCAGSAIKKEKEEWSDWEKRPTFAEATARQA